MFLGQYFSPDEPDLEGPPRPSLMDQVARNMKDPQRRAFLDTSLALMQAGGYSDRPVSLPQALGAAGSRGLQAYREAMRRKEEKEQHERAVKREEEQRAYDRRIEEQQQERAQESHDWNSKDTESAIQHRREMQAMQQREQAQKQALFRELMGGTAPSPQAPGTMAAPPHDPAAPPVMASTPQVTPGEPPPQPLPDAPMPPHAPPPSKKLTPTQVLAAKALGLDVSDVYKFQHGPEMAFQEETAKQRAQKASADTAKLTEKLTEIHAMQDELKELSYLLEGFSGGKLTGFAKTMAEYGESMGLEIDPRLSDKQAAKSLLNKITLKMRGMMGGLPGSVSDKDLIFLKKMGPRLEYTEEGRNKIIDFSFYMLDKLDVYTNLSKRWIYEFGSLDLKSSKTGLYFDDQWSRIRKELEKKFYEKRRDENPN